MQRLSVRESDWNHLLTRRAASGAPGEVFGPIARRNGRFVVAQVGQSLDGRVATASGDARDISGCEGLRHLHRLRALADAVIVGAETVRADDPSLSVRDVPGPSPVRVVIDCHGAVPPSAKMLHDDGTEVLVVTAEDRRLRLPRAQILRLPRGPAGIPPGRILDALAARGLTTVLVEGGARTIARFIGGGLVDRLHVTVAPLIIGAGPSGITLPPVERLAEAQRPRTRVYDIGTDILFDCDLSEARSAPRGAEEQVQMADGA